MVKTRIMKARERIRQEESKAATKYIAQYETETLDRIHAYATRISGKIYLRMVEEPVTTKLKQREIIRNTIKSVLYLIMQGRDESEVLIYAETFMANMLPEADFYRTVEQPVKDFDWKN